jgi:hypothetical protein
MRKQNSTMENFSKFRIAKIINLLTMLVLLSGCNNLSEGLQRRKFEFLYKMNNFASIFADYTGGLYYFNELDFYERRMRKLYEDVNKMKAVDGYGYSRVLKENFLNILDDNIKAAVSLKQKSIEPNEDIRKEYEVIVMNEKVNDYLTALNDEISKVGKE